MKKSIFTLFFVAGTLTVAYSQTSRNPNIPMSAASPGGNSRTGTNRLPDVGTESTRIPIPVVIYRPDDNNAPKVNTAEEDYQLLLGRADAFYDEKRYDEAIDSYNEALTRKDEQYTKDQILRSKAELDRWKKEQEQDEKDRALRLKAESAAGRLNEAYTVHFTGGLVSDHFSSKGISKLYVKDEFSDFLKPGKYNTIDNYLVHANNHTLDGIAVPAGTRLIVYSGRNFEGNVLLDVTGPAIINNEKWRNDNRYKDVNSENYTPDLQAVYPQTTRRWSEDNMHSWVNGSMEIIAE